MSTRTRDWVWRVATGARVAASLLWLFAALVFFDRAILVGTGAFVFTHAGVAALILARFTRHASAQRRALLASAVCDAGGALLLALYVANIGSAYRTECPVPCAPAPPAVTALACAVWHEEPALAVAALALAGATLLVHVATFVLAARDIQRLDNDNQ